MLNQLNILIVDDIFINHIILESIIDDLGHKSDCVKTGLAALEAHKKQNFDIILMDINMPEMDGKTATLKIRELADSKAKIPIIACTADFSEKHINEYITIGMNGLIQKPIEKDALIKALNVCGNGGLHFPHITDKNTDEHNIDKNKSASLNRLLKEIGG